MKRELSMITEAEIRQLNDMKDFLFKEMFIQYIDGELRDKFSDWRELLDHIKYRLQIAPYSYRKITKQDKSDNYYLAKCDRCGWFGSSKLVLGGAPMHDSGDYSDIFCPVCGSNEDLN